MLCHLMIERSQDLGLFLLRSSLLSFYTSSSPNNSHSFLLGKMTCIKEEQARKDLVGSIWLECSA